MEDVIALTEQLIRIPSVNPGLDPSGTGETAIAAFVAGWLRERGFEMRTIGRMPQRPTVIATRTGGPGPVLLLNGHLDTVPAGAAGTEPRRDGDRLHGRGGYDMKGGVAAAMVAAAAARPAGTVVLALVADEEFGSIGTEDALAAIEHADAAVVVEPTGLELTIAHRGFAWYELVVEGRAAHGSQPELGEDAIAGALTLADGIRALGGRLAARPRHPLLGGSSVRIARIDGGTDAATVADRCTITIERRFLPAETPDAVRAELEAAVADAAPQGCRYRLTELVARGALATAEDSAIARAVDTAFAAVTGSTPARRGDPWWTDGGLIAERGIPTVVLGAAGGGAHADDEWVDVPSLRTLAAVLERVIAGVCGGRIE